MIIQIQAVLGHMNRGVRFSLLPLLLLLPEVSRMMMGILDLPLKMPSNTRQFIITFQESRKRKENGDSFVAKKTKYQDS
jgi:hypothetical protein